MKKMLRSVDMFSISQFTLYKSKDTYGTTTGGIMSLLIISALIAIFISMATDIFRYKNITFYLQTLVDPIPTKTTIVNHPANKFMFAIGLVTGYDENSPIMTITMSNFTATRSVSEYSVEQRQIKLELCDFGRWQGVSQMVNTQFKQLNIDYFLCPPKGLQFQLEGKNLEETFKYAKLTVSNCTSYYESSKHNCQLGGIKDPTHGSEKPTINLFFINSIINPSGKDAVSYYIEDANYFILEYDTTLTVNIDFSDYSIKTDESLFPWTSYVVETGITRQGAVLTQSYLRSDDTFMEIILRKSSQRLVIGRSFEKVSAAISFVGGLLQPLLVAFAFLKYFSQFSFEIEFGDRIFKHKSTEPFASQDFGIIQFIKYMFYSALSSFGIGKRWDNIVKYYKCRSQSIKQLDIYLLFRKIQLFEEVCNIVLDDHHLIGLHILSKKTLGESKRARKRYMLQNLIYGQLEKLSRFVAVQEGDFANKRNELLETCKGQANEQYHPNKKQRKKYQKELIESYKRLEEQSSRGLKYSEKIMKKLKPLQQSIEVIENEGFEENNEYQIRQSIETIHPQSQIAIRSQDL